MTSASNFPREMPRPWSIDDFADAIPCPRRQADDLSRIPESGFPPFFGRVGNSRLWDPLSAQAALPAIRQYILDMPQRNAAKRELELRAQEAEFARRQAALNAPQPVWSDPHDDARRAAQVPAGFMRGGRDDAPKQPPSRIGKPRGGY